jgi:hypothetical protein
MIKFSELRDAFFFVGSDSYGMHRAVLEKESGKIYYKSELGDLDEISESDINWDVCIEIPHKNDLDLGRELVFDFVNNVMPGEYERVWEFFHRRGAYARFKDLLHSKGLLQDWYEYENRREEEALREWCEDNGIEVSG